VQHTVHFDAGNADDADIGLELADEFKRAVVARALVGDAAVSRIARELEIDSNQLFN
jgi:hypothetical protein